MVLGVNTRRVFTWMRKVVGSNLGRRCFIYIDRFLLLWKSIAELRNRGTGTALETATIRRSRKRRNSNHLLHNWKKAARIDRGFL